MNIKTLLFLIFIAPSILHGQFSIQEYQKKVDSLLSLAPNQENLTAINQLAFQGKYIDYEITDSVANYVLSNSDKKGFESINGTAYKLKGIVADEAGLYQDAIEYYLKAINKFEAIDSKMDVAKCESNIGFIFYHLKEPEKSMDYFKTALKVFEKENFDFGIMKVLTSMGFSMLGMDQPDSSAFYLRKAESVMKKLKVFDPTIYGNLGNAYASMEKYKLAEENYLICINYYEENNVRNAGNFVWFFNYAETLKKMGKYSKALEYLKKSRELMGDNIFNRRAYSFFMINGSVNYKLGNYKEAADSYNILNKVTDSIYKIDNSRLTAELSEKYQNEKKELEILNLNKRNKIEQEKRKAEEQKVFYLYIGGVLLIIIILFSIVSIYIKIRDNNRIKAKNKLIQQQKATVEEKNKEILDSIQYAKRLQDAILPTHKLVKSYFVESFVLYEPKDIVSGDFYWMEVKDRLTMFAAADCTGHGVPGAMVSVVCANALNKAVNELNLTDPGAILNATRDIVVETYTKTGADVQDGMDISICVYNLETKELLWAGANNPLWIIRKDQRDIDVIKADKQPIGKFGKSVPFTTHKINIEEGDTIYLFSDGFADQFGGENGKKMKPVKFKELLLQNQDKNLDQQKKVLLKAFNDWKGDLNQIDDVCVIGVRF